MEGLNAVEAELESLAGLQFGSTLSDSLIAYRVYVYLKSPRKR